MEKVDEKLMDVVGSASGCSPAYVYMFIEALADGCVKNGLPRQAAYKMVAQAVLGSAKMVLETGKHPGELKDMVCSPEEPLSRDLLPLRRTDSAVRSLRRVMQTLRRIKS